jgi:hypothetical protein
MDSSRITRRRWIAGTGSTLALSTLRVPSWAVTTSGDDDADRARRMQWWHEAKFGMFVHWGLYSGSGASLSTSPWQNASNLLLIRREPGHDWPAKRVCAIW